MMLNASGLLCKLKNNNFITLLLKSGGVKVASVAAVFLISVFLSRILGPEGYGIYTYAFAVAMLVGLPLHGGLSTLIVRSVAQYKLQDEWGCIKGLKKRSNQVVIAACIVVGIFLGTYFSYLEDQLSKFTHELSIFLIPIVSLAAIRSSFLRGLGQPILAQLPEDLLRPYACIGLLFICHYFLGLSPQLAMGVYIVASACALLVGQLILTRQMPAEVLSSEVSYQNRRWMKGVMPFTLIAGIQMLNNQLDVLMIGSMLGKSAVGVYQVAAQVVILVSFPLMVINYVVAPKYAVCFLSDNTESIRNLISSSTKLILIISVPIALLFIIFGDWFVSMVFGVAYSAAYIPLVILVVGQLVNALVGSVAVLLNMAGYENYVATGFGISVLINAVLNFVLVPVWGINGAAVATTSTLVIWNVYMMIILWEKERIKSGVFGLY